MIRVGWGAAITKEPYSEPAKHIQDPRRAMYELSSAPRFSVLLQHTYFPKQWNLRSELSILFNMTFQAFQTIQGVFFSRFSGSPSGYPLAGG